MWKMQDESISRYKVQLSNGCNISYLDTGEGEQTILFIHGLATYALSWQKNIDELKNRYRCIAVDLPGNGYSDRGDYSYSMDFFAGCIYDFIKKLKLTNICLAGHSMGGQIALTLLINEPKAADKLMLFAPAGFETFTPMEKSLYSGTIQFLDFFSSEENSLRKTIRSSFYHVPAAADEMIGHLVNIMHQHSIKEYRKMVESCINSMLEEPVYDKLHAIQQPTLVMYGERDALIPNRMIHPVTTRTIAVNGCNQMPNAQLAMIQSCGHFLQIEKAELVNRYIADFLN
jgi:pimeloyl-ACP methyl ester carboxylesterase